jgi:hypothetical protein
MRKVLMVALLIFVVGFVASCIPAPLQEIMDSVAATPTPAPVPMPIPDPTPSPTPTPEPVSTPAASAATDMQRVGTENFGFIDIPSYWLPFRDISVPQSLDMLQFSDPTGTDIITMHYINTSAEPMTPEEYLNITASFMESIGGVDIAGARVDLNGIDALQIYAFFPESDSFMITFAFETDRDTLLRTITVEGPWDTVLDTMYYVESSFSLSDDGFHVGAATAPLPPSQEESGLIGIWNWMGSPYYLFEANGEGIMAFNTLLEQSIRWTTDNGILSICTTPDVCGNTCFAPMEWYYVIDGNQLDLTSRSGPALSFTYTRQ